MAVGPQYTSDGNTPPTGRQGKAGEAIVSQAGGKYYEDSSRGVTFGASDNATGVATPTTLSTTAIASLFNPANSKVRLALQKLTFGYFSGTLGPGSYYHCLMPLGTAAPSSGTAPAVFQTDAGNISSAAAQGVFRYAPTVVAPTSTGVILPTGFATGVTLATTAVNLPGAVIDIDGELVIEPGAQWQLQSVLGAGSSSPKISVGLTWKEVPIVNSQG
jgi:hypothetical protein